MNLFFVLEAVTTPEVEIRNPLVVVAIIIGVLLFAKQLPQLLADLLGFKLDGNFSLNPMNKLRQTPILGKVAGTVLGSAAGTYAGYKYGAETGHYGRAMLGGLMSGAGAGYKKYDWIGSKDGKSKNAFSSSLGESYKSLSGREIARFGVMDMLPKGAGLKDIEDLKGTRTTLTDAKNAATGELYQQQRTDAELKSRIDNYTGNKSSNEYLSMQDKYNAGITKENQIRSTIDKYDRNIAKVSDQIKDVKKLYRIDDSLTTDVKKAEALAAEIKKEQATTFREGTGDYIRRAGEAVTNTESDLATVQGQLATAQTELDNAIRLRDNYASSLLRVNDDISRLSSTINPIIQMISDIDRNITFVESELVSASTDFDQQVKMLEDLQNQIVNSKNPDEIDNLKQRAAEQERNAQKAQNILGMKEQERIDLISERDRLLSENESFVNELQQNLSGKQTDANNFQQGLDSANARVATAQATVDRLSQEINQINADLAAARARAGGQ